MIYCLIQVALGVTDMHEKGIAGPAIRAAFGFGSSYAGGACLLDKFAIKNAQNFVEWEEVEIASLKLGWPVA